MLWTFLTTAALFAGFLVGIATALTMCAVSDDLLKFYVALVGIAASGGLGIFANRLADTRTQTRLQRRKAYNARLRMQALGVSIGSLQDAVKEMREHYPTWPVEPNKLFDDDRISLLNHVGFIVNALSARPDFDDLVDDYKDFKNAKDATFYFFVLSNWFFAAAHPLTVAADQQEKLLRTAIDFGDSEKAETAIGELSSTAFFLSKRFELETDFDPEFIKARLRNIEASKADPA